MARCWAIFGIFLLAGFFKGDEEDKNSVHVSLDLVTKHTQDSPTILTFLQWSLVNGPAILNLWSLVSIIFPETCKRYKIKSCGSQRCFSVAHRAIVPLNSDHGILKSCFPSPTCVELCLPGTLVQTWQQPQSIGSHNFKKHRLEIKIIWEWPKNRIKTNGCHWAAIFYFLSSAHFWHILQLGKLMWVTCKKLQPLWSCFEPHCLLPSSRSCSNVHLMPPCLSYQHPCRFPPLPLLAGNEFLVLHVIAGAGALLPASERHYIGLQTLLSFVALKVAAVPVPLRGHCKWLQ